jgi:hypothetical protein
MVLFEFCMHLMVFCFIMRRLPFLPLITICSLRWTPFIKTVLVVVEVMLEACQNGNPEFLISTLCVESQRPTQPPLDLFCINGSTAQFQFFCLIICQWEVFPGKASHSVTLCPLSAKNTMCGCSTGSNPLLGFLQPLGNLSHSA